MNTTFNDLAACGYDALYSEIAFNLSRAFNRHDLEKSRHSHFNIIAALNDAHAKYCRYYGGKVLPSHYRSNKKFTPIYFAGDVDHSRCDTESDLHMRGISILIRSLLLANDQGIEENSDIIHGLRRVGFFKGREIDVDEIYRVRPEPSLATRPGMFKFHRVNGSFATSIGKRTLNFIQSDVGGYLEFKFQNVENNQIRSKFYDDLVGSIISGGYQNGFNLLSGLRSRWNSMGDSEKREIEGVLIHLLLNPPSYGLLSWHKSEAYLGDKEENFGRRFPPIFRVYGSLLNIIYFKNPYKGGFASSLLRRVNIKHKQNNDATLPVTAALFAMMIAREFDGETIDNVFANISDFSFRFGIDCVDIAAAITHVGRGNRFLDYDTENVCALSDVFPMLSREQILDVERVGYPAIHEGFSFDDTCLNNELDYVPSRFHSANGPGLSMLYFPCGK